MGKEYKKKSGGGSKWIQNAVHKSGAFGSWCKSQGFGGVTAKCIAHGKASKNPTIRRRANFAATMRKIPHGHSKK
jgi:hypothetical protein